jgi:hypothetical protein
MRLKLILSSVSQRNERNEATNMRDNRAMNLLAPVPHTGLERRVKRSDITC